MVCTILPGVRLPREGLELPPCWMNGVPGSCTVSPWGIRFTTWKEVWCWWQSWVPSCQVYGYHVRGLELPPGWMNGAPRRCTVSPWGVRFTTWMEVWCWWQWWVPSCQVYSYHVRGVELPPGWMKGVPGRCTVSPWGLDLPHGEIKQLNGSTINVCQNMKETPPPTKWG